jgi:hypothetical protein
MTEKSYRKKENKKYERMKHEKTKSFRKGKKQSKPD